MFLVDYFLGSLIRTEGHSFSGSVNNVAASLLLTCEYAEISSHASAATPGNREIVSRTIAAVMCEADVPCSVNTAYPPVSYFSLFHRRTTMPIYVYR